MPNIKGNDYDNILYGDLPGKGLVDTVYAEGGNDTIYAGKGNDIIYAGAGNDLIYSEQGDDIIDGGDGIDTVFYGSKKNNFTIEKLWDGRIRIVDDSGNDTSSSGEILSNIEYLKFKNGDKVVTVNTKDILYVSYKPILGADAATIQDNFMVYDLKTLLNNDKDLNSLETLKIVDISNISFSKLGLIDSITREEVNGVLTITLTPKYNINENPIKIIIDKNNGTAKLEAKGGFETLKAGEAVNLSFDYTVSDSNGDMSTANAVFTIQGNDNRDVYELTQDDGKGPVISAGADNDQIFGNKYDNTLIGDQGDDLIMGGAGKDVIYGDDKNDKFSGHDKLFGGAGSDTIYGGKGNDAIEGGEDVDHIHGGDGNDLLYGEDAANSLTGKTDFIYGGNGNDLLVGGQGNDWLDGQAGNDNVFGGDGDDILVLGQGSDNLFGGAGSDVLWVTGGRSTIHVEQLGTDFYRISDAYGNVSMISEIENFAFSNSDSLLTMADVLSSIQLKPMMDLTADVGLITQIQLEGHFISNNLDDLDYNFILRDQSGNILNSDAVRLGDGRDGDGRLDTLSIDTQFLNSGQYDISVTGSDGINSRTDSFRLDVKNPADLDNLSLVVTEDLIVSYNNVDALADTVVNEIHALLGENYSIEPHYLQGQGTQVNFTNEINLIANTGLVEEDSSTMADDIYYEVLETYQGGNNGIYGIGTSSPPDQEQEAPEAGLGSLYYGIGVNWDQWF